MRAYFYPLTQADVLERKPLRPQFSLALLLVFSHIPVLSECQMLPNNSCWAKFSVGILPLTSVELYQQIICLLVLCPPQTSISDDKEKIWLRNHSCIASFQTRTRVLRHWQWDKPALWLLQDHRNTDQPSNLIMNLNFRWQKITKYPPMESDFQKSSGLEFQGLNTTASDFFLHWDGFEGRLGFWLNDIFKLKVSAFPQGN